jgi:hypothetical protein
MGDPACIPFMFWALGIGVVGKPVYGRIWFWLLLV